jgi:hypothetical protein
VCDAGRDCAGVGRASGVGRAHGAPDDEGDEDKKTTGKLSKEEISKKRKKSEGSSEKGMHISSPFLRMASDAGIESEGGAEKGKRMHLLSPYPGMARDIEAAEQKEGVGRASGVGRAHATPGDEGDEDQKTTGKLNIKEMTKKRKKSEGGSEKGMHILSPYLCMASDVAEQEKKVNENQDDENNPSEDNKSEDDEDEDDDDDDDEDNQSSDVDLPPEYYENYDSC